MAERRLRDKAIECLIGLGWSEVDVAQALGCGQRVVKSVMATSAYRQRVERSACHAIGLTVSIRAANAVDRMSPPPKSKDDLAGRLDELEDMRGVGRATVDEVMMAIMAQRANSDAFGDTQG